MKTLENNTKYRYKNPFKTLWNGVPATKRPTGYASLSGSFFASVVWHILFFAIIWGVTFLIFFFGLAPKIFPKPKAPIKDIEFVLKDDKPIYRHLKSRKAASALAGGGTTTVQKQVQPVENEQKSLSKSSVKPKNNNNLGKNNIFKSLAGRAKVAKSKSSGRGKKGSRSIVPDFSSSGLGSMSSGLSSGSKGRGGRRATGVGSSGSSYGSFDGSGDGTSAHSGRGKSSKKVVAAYDISPYVSELRRNIKWNWRIAKSGSKRVELFLRIAKDGRVVILNVKRTSEIGEVDNAALNAVKRCCPLSPLPSKYGKNFLDVVFVFEANKVGSRY